jgi:predicted transcriptional regulator
MHLLIKHQHCAILCIARGDIMHGTTTSIRLSPALREQLEAASHTLHRGKNWIIAQALVEYLGRLEYSTLAKEAQRQSLLSNQADADIQIWQDNTDTSGWT